MTYSVYAIVPFVREARRLIRKYPSLKVELNALEQQLAKNPFLGTSIGRNCYKIRLSITSKGRGKSAGGRVISHIYLTTNSVFLLALYDKSEIPSISDLAIDERLKCIKK